MRPEPALVQVVGLQHLGWCVHRRDRPSRPLGGVGDLLAGVTEQPRVQHTVEDLLGLGAAEGVRPGERVGELRAIEDEEHLVELLGRHHHRHVAVGARVDAERKQRGVGIDNLRRNILAAAVLPAQVARHPPGVDRNRLARGTIDDGAGARGAGP